LLERRTLRATREAGDRERDERAPRNRWSAAHHPIRILSTVDCRLSTVDSIVSTAVIEVEGLSKVYDARTAVEDLSFSVQRGEILGLVGSNGAGKTTTLRILAGVLPATRGLAKIAGFDVAKHPIEAKSRLALVTHDPSLFGNLTVWEHVELVARIYKVEDPRPKALELLTAFELADRLETMADELSRGQQQKVALTCALLHEPEALLLDEPLTGLDPRAIRTLYDLMRAHAARGAAIIMSSHLLDLVERIASRYLILGRGKRLFFGSKSEIHASLPALRQDASLEELFLHATEGAPSLE
jgi:ABC-2 type transport system ATP-binding protein